MSKKALYRNRVAILDTYQKTSSSQGQLFWSPEILWTKGNVQPYKAGIEGSVSPDGVFFSDWRVLYVKELPPFDLSKKPVGYEKARSYYWYEGNWYFIQSKQEWETQARGVKHLTLIGELTGDFLDAPPDLTPLSKLVNSFERVTKELKLTSTVTKGIK